MSVTQTTRSRARSPTRPKTGAAMRPGCSAASNRHRRLGAEQVERYQTWFENNRRMWVLTVTSKRFRYKPSRLLGVGEKQS